jgi:hypothetical protein
VPFLDAPSGSLEVHRRDDHMHEESSTANTLAGAVCQALGRPDSALAQAVAHLDGTRALDLPRVAEAFSSMRVALPPERDFTIVQFCAVVFALQEGHYRARSLEAAIVDAATLQKLLGLNAG